MIASLQSLPYISMRHLPKIDAYIEVFNHTRYDSFGKRIDSVEIKRVVGTYGILTSEDLRHIPDETLLLISSHVKFVGKWRDAVIYINASNKRKVLFSLIELKIKLLFALINDRTLATLVVWDLCDHVPGAYSSWSDVKLFKMLRRRK